MNLCFLVVHGANSCVEDGRNIQPTTSAVTLLSITPRKPVDFDASTIQSQNSTITPSVRSSPILSQHHSEYTHDADIVVDWDGPDDHENPRNWTKKRRWVVTLVVSLFTFIRFVPTFCSAVYIKPALVL